MKPSQARPLPIGLVTVDDIRAAHRRIQDHIHRTPVVSSTLLDKLSGSEVHFKCENLQKVGAFKARGALNAVLGLPDNRLGAGVATHSSGNHGAALAMAAGARGIPAYIVMPSTAPAVKKAAVEGYGGIVIECEPTLVAREETLGRVVAEHEAHVVHPYDDPRIISGQGTVGLELLEQVPDFDTVLVPVGGGGLISGIAGYLKSTDKKVQIIGCQPENSAVMYESIKAGEIIEMASSPTVADGTAGGIEPGSLTFDICREVVDDYILVSEKNIKAAIRHIIEQHQMLIEGAAALSVACLLKDKTRFKNKQTVLIISGKKITSQLLKEILSEHP